MTWPFWLVTVKMKTCGDEKMAQDECKASILIVVTSGEGTVNVTACEVPII